MEILGICFKTFWGSKKIVKVQEFVLADIVIIHKID